MDAKTELDVSAELQDDDIAIVGMACRFPGAPDKEAYWKNLCDGVDSLQRLAPADLAERGVEPALAGDASYIWSSGQLADTEAFDAPFFGYSPREAELMDPQHRHFLETSWAALEDAGYRPTSAPGSVGVFAGTSMNKYLLHNIFRSPALGGMDDWDGGIPPGSSPDAMPARVAYKLGLSGPSVTVLTACSSSLTAICTAADSLQNYTCDMALAGGVAIELPEVPGYRVQDGGLLSKDGICRPYDAAASGSVFGSGVGVVVLKRLKDALDSGDHLYGVLRGWAVNNDGSARAGYAAPGVDGQAAVILEALTAARLRPNDLGYVEGHGSATKVGDPIEVRALTKAFTAAKAEGSGFCGLGSVKGNIGHVDAAAGVAGLIKTVLALTGDRIPPTLHFEQANPEADFEKSPFHVVARPTPWAEDATRRAGVSSFGMGGANAHVVLEEPPARPGTPRTRPYELMLVSAGTEHAAREAASRLSDALWNTSENLEDVGFTLTRGREELPFRRAAVAGDTADGAAVWAEGRRSEVYTGEVPGDGPRPVTMMFPGVGDPYEDIALDLYQCEEVFRREVDRCAAAVEPLLGADLREHLFPSGGWREPWNGRVGGRKPEPDLRAMAAGRGRDGGEPEGRTVFDQPATFVLEYALARQFMAWGVVPESLIGHSVGEYVAACLAGVFDVSDALRIVTERARLIDRLPTGGMLAVPLPEDEVTPYLRPGVWLGAVNASALCVLSGDRGTLAEVEAELLDKGVVCRRVRAEHAFHSPVMEAIRAEVAEVVDAVTLHPPRIPYLSGVTGDWITEDQATSAEYWTTHMCHTVRFAAGVETLAKNPRRLYVELGPGQTLAAFTLGTASGPGLQDRVISASQSFLSTGSAVRSVLEAVGRIWVAGGAVDLVRLHSAESRRRVSLPAYPFERRRYWVDRVTPATLLPDKAVRADHGGAGTVAAPAPYSAPRPVAIAGHSGDGGSTEEVLAAAWSELLGYEEVGAHDDFFRLGGHSLLALQLTNKLWNDHGLRLPYTALLEYRTIHELAAVLDNRGDTPPEARQPAQVQVSSHPGPESAQAADRRTVVARILRSEVESVLGRRVSDGEVLARHEIQPVSVQLAITLKRELGMPVYPAEIEERPALALLGTYLTEQWTQWSSSTAELSREDEDRFRHEGPSTDEAGFILSSPRAGSTLLRVMLAGHPDLFCPPELHLLATRRMAERRAVERGSDRNQGIQRAFMELLDIDAEQAAARITDYEHGNAHTASVFRKLVGLSGERLLVDKSPGNARYLETLLATEELTGGKGRYVHLVRHPYAVMESMARNRFTQLMGVGTMDAFEFAEHIWTQYNANIGEFLSGIEPERHCVVHYEDLVREPRETMTRICRTLGVEFQETLLHPYQGRRMRDGLGDPNFLQHSAIDPTLADAWQTVRIPRRLNAMSRRLAASFGYELR
ncbi:beta-ketoacyl synthase N-terminal-like domain-containing protein [Streptomyces sp. NPDC087658]|uniref:beta-ketoacyl synthase N-terminal-like domain-containing protein n=1 Tax=Streptomyces sp. NPDC087658 TaxID=3365800 RepID=UPI00381A3A1D